MILLEFHNRIIEEVLKRAFTVEKPESVNVTIADFDGVLFHLSNSGCKTKIQISINWSCISELKEFGLDEVIKREYGDFLTTTETGYDLSILIDVTDTSLNKEEVIKKASLLKRNCFAAPFEKCFAEQTAGKKSESPMIISYRSDSTLYMSAEADRVTCVFSTTFKDDDDIVIGKVFLQEFVDARRSIQEAPQVIFSQKEPPRELQGTKALTSDNISYVTFVMFPRHFSPAKINNTINLLQTFRDYLHYHIKCSKAYLHCRMRARVSSSLKILNRARPETKKEQKTASGKTFVRK